MEAQSDMFSGKSSRSTTLSLVEKIKEDGEDWSWYPTTDSILATIKSDIEETCLDDHPSVLDCGAGDGRALMALTNGDRYAIEKSTNLINAMDESIFIVGTEFREQALLDLRSNILFCNPPYSEYSSWLKKIITEANSPTLYFVVPKRWSENKDILDALKRREAEYSVIGEFDFLNADRAARVDVEIVKVILSYKGHSRSSLRVDPFDLWFDEHFKIEIDKEESSKYSETKLTKEAIHEKTENAIVSGDDLISALSSLYQHDLDQLIKNYQALQDLDPVLLKELGVNLGSVKNGLKLKIQGLKDTYWAELFNRLNAITSRLTKKSRERQLDVLTSHTHVDFSPKNAYAILIWVIRNSNKYHNSQLIDLVESMTEKASIVLYKSNQRTVGDEDWRYTRRPKNLDKYGLDYRLVISRMGGIHDSSSYWDSDRFRGLSERAFDFINDILTVASSIGFDTKGLDTAANHEWVSNKAVVFQYKDHVSGELFDLMQVRCFKNGNIHIKFNEKFICTLNCEFGRLKGWIKSPREASEELDIPLSVAETSFNSSLYLGMNSLLQLSAPSKKG